MARNNDHNYVGSRTEPPVPVINNEISSVETAEEPPVLRRTRRRRNRRQRVETTDHDYFASNEAIAIRENLIIVDDNETEVDEETAQPEVQQVENTAISSVLNNVSATVSPPSRGLEEIAGTSSAALIPSASNFATPPKKRKRLSLGPNSNTPKINKGAAISDAGEADDAEKEDDGLTCSICFDTWEMSGEHRLVSLRCGHLFGDACIRRWLDESARQSGIKVCPQCKTKAATKDIRCLYAKRLRALDRSEEHRLREQLESEQRKTQSQRLELETLKMSFTIMSNKFSSLEADNMRMKQIISDAGLSTNPDTQKMVLLRRYKLYNERTVELTREPGCRVMINADKLTSLIVSQRSTQNLFPGFGLRMIDTGTFKPLAFVHASAKLLRDLSLNTAQVLLGVASIEPRAKLFDLRTNHVVNTFSPSDKLIWACAIDRNERDHFLYLGGQHGGTYLYDMRVPETVMDEFKTDGDFSPVINIATVSADKLFPSGGFLVCKLMSLWFFEYTSASGTVTPTRLAVEGPFISMNYNAIKETLLIQVRSNSFHPMNSCFIFGALSKIDGTPIFNEKMTFFGSKVTPVMTRCTQIAVESNTLIAGYIQDAKHLALFDTQREKRMQTMAVNEVIYDTCAIYKTPDCITLAALSDRKCRFYRVTSLPHDQVVAD